MLSSRQLSGELNLLTHQVKQIHTPTPSQLTVSATLVPNARSKLPDIPPSGTKVIDMMVCTYGVSKYDDR